MDHLATNVAKQSKALTNDKSVEAVGKKIENLLKRENTATISSFLKIRNPNHKKVNISKIESGYFEPNFFESNKTVDFFSKPSGLQCPNLACGLKTAILTGDSHVCRKCSQTGYPKQSDHGKMSFFCPIRGLNLGSVVYISLIARRSGGASVSSDVFQKLRNLVKEKKNEIIQFIGKEVQLHIVAEFAGYGSALAEPSEMNISCDSESDSNLKHTPLANLSNFISVLYREGDWIAYVLSCPGDFTSKVQNMINNHQELLDNGIPLEKVLYIAYGVEIGSGINGYGVIENFTIFTAQQFNDFISQNLGKVLEKSTESNVAGYCTGMLYDFDGREHLLTKCRSVMAGMNHS